MMRTLRPALPAVMPKLTVSEVLPTPPFPLATAITRSGRSGILVSDMRFLKDWAWSNIGSIRI